jgi:pimeloyl-ACP methyl ester carboxylesterase
MTSSTPAWAPSKIDTLAIDTGELRLHALAAGPQDGPLAVLLHGFPETSHGWAKQILPLAEAGLRVVAPDQRGIGRSDKPAGAAAYRLERLAADIVGLVRALGRERARIVGHDWGGVVAWELASRHPGQVERAAILNAPHPAVFPGYLLRHPTQALRSWYMAFFQLPWLPEAALAAGDFELLARTLVRTSRPGAFSSLDLRNYREAWSEPGALAGMLAWYRALALPTRPPRPARAAVARERVTVPVRLLWGDRDTALEPGLAEASIALCDRGEVVHLPEATHWLQHEEPRRVNELLLEFLLAP